MDSPKLGGPAALGAWLLRACLFAMPVLAAVFAVQRAGRPLLPGANGPGIGEIMRRSFDGAVQRRYDWLLVGNSRIFRGVNPDQLTVPAFNFAHDADAFNQVYYKLLYLDRHGVRFTTLVMGVDYFEFATLNDSRNAAYAPLLGTDYMRDYGDTAGHGLAARLTGLLHPIDENAFNTYMIVNVTRPAAALLARALAALTGDRPVPPERSYLRDNGQLVVDREVAHEWDLVRRDPSRLPLQVRYFHLILEWARARGLTIVLVMPPAREIELSSYPAGAIGPFDDWLTRQASEFGATYLNYSRDPSFGMRDFADLTHLTEASADRFSRQLDRDLVGLAH